MYRFITQCLLKKLYYIIAVGLLFMIFYSINITNDRIYDRIIMKTFSSNKPATERVVVTETIRSFSERTEDMIYVLIWTNSRNTPLVYLGEGQSVLINKSCSWNNCYVTSDRNLLGDYTEFEAIVFNGPELYHYRYINDLPKRRYPHQKYVYANIEAAAMYPICTEFWNNFFNWTWSYRTDSNLFWPYFSIRGRTNNIVDPKRDATWINLSDMDPIDEQLKVSLSSKTKAAAWFVSNCDTMSLREQFVKQLEDQMQFYGLELDIYGRCGKLQCPRKIMNRCQRMLDEHYYFYLAFENSISEDYVTEKILHALLHNTVPVVLGGANYSRFMPDGIYLNALELGPRNLAKKMFELIQNPKAYYEFFKWKKHYSYHYTHESPETDVYCRFCEYLNTNKLNKEKSVYKYFNLWWTPQRYCRDVISVKID